MKMLIQDLDAKGGQLKETGEKLALTSARCSQEPTPVETNIYKGNIFYNVYNVYNDQYLSKPISMKEIFLLFFQSPHVCSLEQTKADLMESMGESRKRKDEIGVSSCFLLQMSFPSCEYVQVHLKVLNGKLRSEKAECAALQARFS